jgi:glycosyltransferase involved in cell wall biosynthesis
MSDGQGRLHGQSNSMQTDKSGREPMVSIITPSFNQVEFIERTIESIRIQDYPRIEHIVIDGGSTDGTLEVLKRYEDRLRWISEKDSGQSEAINKGFRLAQGDILAWLNSDDILLPGAISKVVQFLSDHPNAMMVYGEGYMIDGKDNVKSRFPFTEPKFDLWKLIHVGDYILQQSTFFRKSVFDTIPMLDEGLHYGLDWDLFIRIGKRFHVEYIPEYLGCIREHGDAKTSTGGTRRFRELVKLIRGHGIFRYPLAYFNYASGTFEKWPRASNSRLGNALRLGVAQFLKKALSVYLRRLQQGYYSDGWVSKRATIVLPNLSPEKKNRHLSISAEVRAPNIPIRISVRINKQVLFRHKAKQPGAFTLTAPIPDAFEHSDCYHITIKSSKSYVPSRRAATSDPRELAFLLKSISIADGVL